MSVLEFIAVIVFICGAAYTATTVFRLIASIWVGRSHPPAEMAVYEERLAKLEASMENMSAETQRLTDGHRFFTELLVKRTAPPAIASGNPAAASNHDGSR